MSEKRRAQKSDEVHEPAKRESQEDSSIDLVDTVFAQMEDFPERGTEGHEIPMATDVSEPKENMGVFVNSAEKNRVYMMVKLKAI